MGKLCALSLACVLAAACGSTPPSGPTTSTPPPAGNRAPVVSLAFLGASSCVPIPPLDGMPGRPCGLPVIAQATDPDGDLLTYKWTGCTTFGFPPSQSTCYVRQVGAVTATVTVDDGHGNTATASVSGQGINPPPGFINHPPSVSLPKFSPITVPADSATLEGFGGIGDPDEGELCGAGDGTGSGVGGCPWLTAASVSGDCKSQVAVLGCDCLGGLTIDIYRSRPAGTCTLTLTVRDSWGLTTTSAFAVSYDQTSGPFKTVSLPQSAGAVRVR